mmetsp:Transcript_19389/g.44675  ORF Transcript_19389/g.44675 Transcript_19389/m.44675 type:complete len:115 (-) Transcript_19389:15-359(-)
MNTPTSILLHLTCSKKTNPCLTPLLLFIFSVSACASRPVPYSPEHSNPRPAANSVPLRRKTLRRITIILVGTAPPPKKPKKLENPPADGDPMILSEPPPQNEYPDINPAPPHLL